MTARVLHPDHSYFSIPNRQESIRNTMVTVIAATGISVSNTTASASAALVNITTHHGAGTLQPQTSAVAVASFLAGRIQSRTGHEQTDNTESTTPTELGRLIAQDTEQTSLGDGNALINNVIAVIEDAQLTSPAARGQLVHAAGIVDPQLLGLLANRLSMTDPHELVQFAQAAEITHPRDLGQFAYQVIGFASFEELGRLAQQFEITETTDFIQFAQGAGITNDPYDLGRFAVGAKIAGLGTATINLPVLRQLIDMILPHSTSLNLEDNNDSDIDFDESSTVNSDIEFSGNIGEHDISAAEYIGLFVHGVSITDINNLRGLVQAYEISDHTDLANFARLAHVTPNNLVILAREHGVTRENLFGFIRALRPNPSQLAALAREYDMTDLANLGALAHAAGLTGPNRLAELAQSCNITDPTELGRLVNAAGITHLDYLMLFASRTNMPRDPQGLGEFIHAAGITDLTQLGQFANRMELRDPDSLAIFYRHTNLGITVQQLQLQLQPVQLQLTHDPRQLEELQIELNALQQMAQPQAIQQAQQQLPQLSAQLFLLQQQIQQPLRLSQLLWLNQLQQQLPFQLPQQIFSIAQTLVQVADTARIDLSNLGNFCRFIGINSPTLLGGIFISFNEQARRAGDEEWVFNSTMFLDSAEVAETNSRHIFAYAIGLHPGMNDYNSIVMGQQHHTASVRGR